MKFYDIMLFLFILNLTIGLVNMLNLTAPFTTQVQGFGEEYLKTGEEKLRSSVNENKNVIETAWNWITEQVSLVLRTGKILFDMFVNAAIWPGGMYRAFICQGGVDCSPNSPITYLITMMSAFTLFVNVMGFAQWVSGRSVKEVE